MADRPGTRPGRTNTGGFRADSDERVYCTDGWIEQDEDIARPGVRARRLHAGHTLEPLFDGVLTLRGAPQAGHPQPDPPGLFLRMTMLADLPHLPPKEPLAMTQRPWRLPLPRPT